MAYSAKVLTPGIHAMGMCLAHEYGNPAYVLSVGQAYAIAEKVVDIEPAGAMQRMVKVRIMDRGA